MSRYPINPPEMRQPRLAYHRQRCQARFRHDGWDPEFTFEVWFEIWRPFWLRRGTQGDRMIMVRKDPSQPWHWDNVSIMLRSDWMKEIGGFKGRQPRKKMLEFKNCQPYGE